ncbi:MAG: trypsin-like peptidase domain-containing protein, partial [Planctomycetes bacterium]|nr:trypsin-like peptidase domain-containing protein [Planctomycetota bacterium]
MKTLAITLSSSLLLLGSVLADDATETIELPGGKRLDGVVIKETQSDLFVDLGYTIVSVPRSQVIARHAAAGEGETAAPLDRDPESIFEIGRLAPVTVQDAVKQFGEGVVQVRCPGGTGSGFITDPRGYIVTNYHVIENERDVEVTLYLEGENGLEKKRVKNVEIVAINEFMDLALLRIPDAEQYHLSSLTIADPDALKVGDKVFAIGAPLGLERTVTEGIVSDSARSFSGQCYIQIDVAINPGNSGGPLFNSRGEVVGVTNMKFRGTEGLNFAIPVDHVVYFLKRRASFLF